MVPKNFAEFFLELQPDKDDQATPDTSPAVLRSGDFRPVSVYENGRYTDLGIMIPETDI